MGDPPAQYDRGRDWNVDLIPKFLMANGKNYSAHNVNRYFFVFYILSVGSQRMARICHSFIPFFFASPSPFFRYLVIIINLESVYMLRCLLDVDV